ncbi:MAG: glycoside hydrolase [Anaerolineae bacterium]|nr:glycoside hydrolase [Anaerolineae bacterium]
MKKLEREVRNLGKPAWRHMLQYVAALHERAVHEPRYPFLWPWEEIGPGYCYGPAFGHWDLVHAILDVLPAEPGHARLQILNNLAAQEEDGLVPGSIWMAGPEARWSKTIGYPPVWPVAVQDYVDLGGTADLIAECYEPLIRQIAWFEAKRQAQDGGFYYMDILDRHWESGIDEGIRFHEVQTGPYACIDATSHVYWIYKYAGAWADMLGQDASEFVEKADALCQFIQNALFDAETGFFYDIWAVRDSDKRHVSFEGMWPIVVGAATKEQANRVIDEYLLNPERFFAQHPISTVALNEPLFELRMWRGPTWNSMTYWAARGCLRYGRADAAVQLLERALDAVAAQFDRSGTIWEFYDPRGGNPEELERKPHTPYNEPCREYLGHNPLIAMARLFKLSEINLEERGI